MGTKAQKQNFINGALILMVSGILIKVIGAIFKIPLGNLLPPNGMVYFTAAYEIYTAMYIIATAGLPAAVSRMVAENNANGKYKESERVFRVTLRCFSIVGIVGSLFLFFGADILAHFISNPMSRLGIMVIAPAIFFETLMSTYRGYYQGYQNMIPTAISQLLASILKLVVGYALAIYLSSHGYTWPIVAAGAIAGVTAGSVVSTAYLMIRKARDKQIQSLIKSDVSPLRFSSKQMAKRLFAIAIPITIGSSALSITNLLDMAVVMNRLLYSGMTQKMAEDIYGIYTGYARVLFNLPSAVIVSLGISLIPALASKITIGQRKEGSLMIDQTIRITMILSTPCAFGLAMLSKPILNLLYGSQPMVVEQGAPLLTALGPAVVFVCFVSVTSNILQAIGQERKPMLSILIGGIVKLVLNWVLVGIPAITINAAPFSTNVCYAVIMSLNLFFIYKETGYQPQWWISVAKPMIAAALCGCAALLSYKLFEGILGAKISVLAAICVAGVVYLAAIFILKVMTRNDFEMMPGGKKAVSALNRLGYKF